MAKIHINDDLQLWFIESILWFKETADKPWRLVEVRHIANLDRHGDATNYADILEVRLTDVGTGKKFTTTLNDAFVSIPEVSARYINLSGQKVAAYVYLPSIKQYRRAIKPQYLAISHITSCPEYSRLLKNNGFRLPKAEVPNLFADYPDIEAATFSVIKGEYYTCAFSPRFAVGLHVSIDSLVLYYKQLAVGYLKRQNDLTAVLFNESAHLREELDEYVPTVIK